MTIITGHDSAKTRRTLAAGGAVRRLLLDPRRRGGGPRQLRQAAGEPEGGAGEHAALRGRQDRHPRRHPGVLGLGQAGRQEPARDRLSPGPGADAGLHRRAGGGRSGGDARRHHRARRRPAEDQPAEPGRPGHRPFGDDRRIRQPARLPDERRPRIRAQHGALRVPEMGPEGVPELPRGAARAPASAIRSTWNTWRRRSGPTQDQTGATVAYPDTLVGTDSHTTMVNGLAVLGWGVGGIEAEAAMLGQPIIDADPGSGRLQDHRQDARRRHRHRSGAEGGADAAQARRGQQVRRILRPRASTTCRWPTAPPSATWRPEYGATCGFFPVDGETLRYLRQTGRDEARVALVEAYAKANGMWRGADYDPIYTSTLHLDLGEVVPAISGPKRPQDHIALDIAAPTFGDYIAGLRPAPAVDETARSPTWTEEGGGAASERHPRPSRRAEVRRRWRARTTGSATARW